MPVYFWASLQFLGVTPGGLNATGENDLKNHCDNIAAQREKQFRPPLEYALNVLQMNEFGRVDESVRFHFVPLAQEDANGKAQLGKLKADTAAVYLNARVLAPKDVRAALAEDASDGYHGIDPEALPEPEQNPMGKEGMPGRAPQGTESLEFPSPNPSLLNRKMGNDSAITGDEDGSKKKHGGTPAVVDGVSGYWVTMNGQPVFIDEEGMIRAGMGGKFNGKKLDEMTDADWKQGGVVQEGEKAEEEWRDAWGRSFRAQRRTEP